jgi:glycosyltransferase involved in cell wall biosynthesis
VPWKGFDALKRVAANLAQKLPALRLEIKHHSSREQIINYLASADVFVLNTAYEGFPHIVWEAMAVGTPVVTTNVGGNPELITDGENGILVEFNNEQQLAAAIATLYHNPALRQRLGAEGQKTAAKFSLDSMINQTEKLLLQCVS